MEKYICIKSPVEVGLYGVIEGDTYTGKLEKNILFIWKKDLYMGWCHDWKKYFKKKSNFEW